MNRAIIVLGIVLCFVLDCFAQSLDEPVPMSACNSTSADYAPSFDPRTRLLTFTSERTGKAGMYRCGAQTDGRAEVVPGTFVNANAQRGFVTFTSSGEAFGVAYFPFEAQSYAGIVTISREDGALNLGKAVEVLNGSFFVSQPAVAPDGSRMVVCSDRNHGAGGLDLWISDRRDDLTWGEPIGLGHLVNSLGDEITPMFLSADTLAFASNGIGGKGGFDIFFTVYRDGAWQEPMPLEELNSEFDEGDCTLIEDGTFVFASNRPGGVGGLDLWLSRRSRH